MSYFLLVYDRMTGAVDVTDYGDQRDRAMRDRFQRELAERTRPEVEVVVLSAASRQALESTHARYFRSVRELAESGLMDVGP